MISANTTIAVTGSTGQIATVLIPLLADKGYRIKALVHKHLPSVDLSMHETVRGSLDYRESLDQLVRDCQAVVHCAARISIRSNQDPLVYETNVNGTFNLFEAARKAGVKRFIHVSSIHAYDEIAAGEVLNEDSPYCSDRAARYDRSKRDAQRSLLEQASPRMEVVVLNPTAVIGPPDYLPSLMGKAIIDIYKRRVPMLIRGGFDFVDVRDVAAGILAALDRGRSGQSYLLSGQWHSLKELQEIILGIKGDRSRIPVAPAWAGWVGLPFTRLLSAFNGHEPLYTRESLITLVQGHRQISHARAERELGYTSRPLSETIADSVSWFRKNGYL